MKILAPQSGTGFFLARGERLKVVDLEGGQVADLFCFDAHDPRDSLSSGRSVDYNDTIYLTEGHSLYSHRSEAMLKIVEDTCRRHDFLMTPCSLRMFQGVAGNDEYHPSCLENLAHGLAPFGFDEDRISTTFNVFMNVGVGIDGRLDIFPPLSRAGDHVVFEALRDLHVGLTACSHEGSNGGVCKPIGYEVLGAEARAGKFRTITPTVTSTTPRSSPPRG